MQYYWFSAKQLAGPGCDVLGSESVLLGKLLPRARDTETFHSQNLAKLTLFIKTAKEVFGREDIISIASVYGVKDKKSDQLLGGLARRLKATKTRNWIKSKTLKIKLIKIRLEPIGKAEKLKELWNDRQWFKEDYCKGPGNVLFILPNGNVKPCCGYANELDALSIGNINKDTLKAVLNKAKSNSLVTTIFESGLSKIRQCLKNQGIVFPGKTSNHCYFCCYILTKVPKNILNNCLRRFQ